MRQAHHRCLGRELRFSNAFELGLLNNWCEIPRTAYADEVHEHTLMNRNGRRWVHGNIYVAAVVMHKHRPASGVDVLIVIGNHSVQVNRVTPCGLTRTKGVDCPRSGENGKAVSTLLSCRLSIRV